MIRRAPTAELKPNEVEKVERYAVVMEKPSCCVYVVAL